MAYHRFFPNYDTKIHSIERIRLALILNSFSFKLPISFSVVLLCVGLVSVQPDSVDAGENEARALAKLFPTDTISVQRLETGRAPEDQAFLDDFNARLMKAIESDAAIREQIKASSSATSAEQAGIKNLLLKKIGASDSDIQRLDALSKELNPEPYLSGPIIFFHVSRTDSMMSFQMKEGTAIDNADIGLKSAIELLSNLKLKIDATEAELMGQAFGPAEWIDFPDKRVGRKRGLQWSGRALNQPDNTILDTTASFIYHEKLKQLRLTLGVWPSGKSPDTGKIGFFSMKSVGP